MIVTGSAPSLTPAGSTPSLTPAPATEAFTDAVLEHIAAATWPDGSTLVDVDPTVLRDQLAPRIRAAAYALVATAATQHNLTPRGGPR